MGYRSAAHKEGCPNRQLLTEPCLTHEVRAFIEANLSFLVKSQLEVAGLPLNRSLAVISEAQDRIDSVPGSKGNVFKEKLAQVMQKNQTLS